MLDPVMLLHYMEQVVEQLRQSVADQVDQRHQAVTQVFNTIIQVLKRVTETLLGTLVQIKHLQLTVMQM